MGQASLQQKHLELKFKLIEVSIKYIGIFEKYLDFVAPHFSLFIGSRFTAFFIFNCGRNCHPSFRSGKFSFD